MNRLAWIALFLPAASLLHAQEPAPSPAQTSIPVLEISADETPVATNQPAKSNPKLDKQVNLAETPDAPDPFAIEPPADAPAPEKIPELTGPLPDEEESRPLPPVSGTVAITAKDNGQTVAARVGNLIRITLESNPSTGYNWELHDFKFGPSIFHGSELVPRDGGNVLFGAPGDTVITLQAIEPGAQNIALIYRRPWEPVEQAAARFAFQLDVEKPAAPSPAPPVPTPAP